MSRSGASMEALIGLAKQKLKEKNKEKKEAEAAAKLKSTAAKKRPFEEVKDIFMDTTIESKEDSPKDITENVKESKSKKKKVSSDLPKEDDKGDKEPEAKVEEVPANPIDAIMKEIASLQADVETFEKIKKVKKAKKRKRKHSSSSSSSSDESDDEPSVELEEKVEEEIAVEVKGLGSLVTGYDSDEFEDDENFELSKPKVAEKVMPKASPNLDDDFIFLKPTIPANMIPPQVAGGPKREKVKKIGLCDRLMQQGGQTENKTENASTPLKPISAKDSINAVYVYNPLTGKREKAESKPAEANAGTDSKDAQLLSVSRSPLMSESLKDSILDNSSKGETKSITAEPTPLKTSNSANEPQYKYNPLTGYRDLLVETKPFLGPFTVGASSVKAEKVEKTENAEAVAQPFARKGICKFFNMKFGCRHGENCRFKHEKYKQAAFNYENAYQNVQGQETKASVMTGSLENKETDISPSEFYRTFIAKSLKQKKGAGIFFEKAKENLIPEETNVMAEKTIERIDVINQNGLKSETRELVDNYNDDAAKKQEKTPRRTEKNKDFVKCNRESKEIAGGIINEIIDTIFATRSFGNSKSKSRSRSSSISLSNSSDLEEESNQEARTLKRREKRKRQEPKRKPRSKPCSRSRSRSQSKDRKKSRNSSSTDKERKKSSRRKQKSRSRDRDRDRIRYSRSRSPSRPRVRVLPSSYLEQVRNGIPPEWNEEKYKQPRHIELLEEENEPNSRNKRRKNDSEEKIILPGLEELLSIEKNKECPRVLKNSIGIVTSIINESYAIAAVTLPYSKVSDNERKGPFRVLFDTCEFWIENRTASDLGISLEQVITVGDYVKINAILIEKPNIRNINYMATATKTSDNISNLLKEKFTEEIATNDIKEVSKSKLDNFDVVVKFLSSSPITEEEMKIEMKSEKDADSNLLSRAREWKNWLYYNTQSSAKSSGLERNLKKLSDNLSEDEGNRRKLTRTKVSKEFREKERRRRSSRDSDEIQCVGGKSRDSIKGKNGICDKRFNKSSKRSSSSDDEDERDRPSRSRDKSRRNGSRSSETRKRKKSSSRSRSRERKNKRSQEKERRSNRSRSRGKEYRKRRPSKSPPKKYRSRSREKETERKPSRRLREEEYERKTSSRSQEKDHRRKRSDRSSEKDYKRRRSTSRERKPNGGRSKERDSKRKSSTESLVSLSGREPCTRLPANFSYWNENLIKCLDDGEYIDCIHCQETLATKPEHNFLPYYLDHYSSVEHALKMVESSVIDQDCVNDYIAHSSELDYFIQLELDRGAAQVIYDEGDLRLFLCKYCHKVGTTAWHFYKLKNSKLHSPEELRL